MNPDSQLLTPIESSQKLDIETADLAYLVFSNKGRARRFSLNLADDEKLEKGESVLSFSCLLCSEHTVKWLSADGYEARASFRLNSQLLEPEGPLRVPNVLLGLNFKEGDSLPTTQFCESILSVFHSALSLWLSEMIYEKASKLSISEVQRYLTEHLRESADRTHLAPDADGCLVFWSVESAHYVHSRREVFQTSKEHERFERDRRKERIEFEDSLKRREMEKHLAHVEALKSIDLDCSARMAQLTLDQKLNQETRKAQRHLAELERMQAETLQIKSEETYVRNKIVELVQKTKYSEKQHLATLERIQLLSDACEGMKTDLIENANESLRADVYFRSFKVEDDNFWVDSLRAFRVKRERMHPFEQLNSGESFQLVVESSIDVHVYLIGYGPESKDGRSMYKFYRYVDNDGEDDLGYSDLAEKAFNFVAKGSIAVFPEDFCIPHKKGRVWTLNDQPGLETLFVILSRARLPISFFSKTKFEVQRSQLSTRGPVSLSGTGLEASPDKGGIRQSFNIIGENLIEELGPSCIIKQFRFSHDF